MFKCTTAVPPPYHINVKWNRIVLKSDCSARILHFAFREIDSQIMIVLRFRGSEIAIPAFSISQ